MISGEAVGVELRVLGAPDSYGNAVETFAEAVEVGDVLVGAGGVDNVPADDGQPLEVSYDRTFHFPRTWTGDLRGAIVTHGGERFEVVDAYGYTDANIPPGIKWNAVAKAVRLDERDEVQA